MCLATATLDEAYQEFQDELLKHRLLISLGVPGLYGLGGDFEYVIEQFERLVTTQGANFRAEVMRFPAIMSRQNYLKTTHIQTFPDLMGSVHSFTGNERQHLALLNKRAQGEDWTTSLTPTDVMLTPAACYPLYPTATGTLTDQGRVVDLRSFVFRHEPSVDPARMQIFRQREYVRLGSADQALAHRDLWLKLGQEILKSVGLKVQPVIANDPFFGRGGQVMASAQREQDLKYELVIPIATSEKPTAIASCNYHLNYFGQAFGIHTPDGQPAHTACIGFGLERIALALFKTHGFRLNAWPHEIKTLLAL